MSESFEKGPEEGFFKKIAKIIGNERGSIAEIGEAHENPGKIIGAPDHSMKASGDFLKAEEMAANNKGVDRYIESRRFDIVEDLRILIDGLHIPGAEVTDSGMIIIPENVVNFDKIEALLKTKGIVRDAYQPRIAEGVVRKVIFSDTKHDIFFNDTNNAAHG